MKEKTSYRLKTIGGVGLAAAISIGAISEQETGDPFSIPITGWDYLSKVPELTMDYVQNNNCERTLPQNIVLVENLLSEKRPDQEKNLSKKEFAIKTAQEHGLHLIDDKFFINAIDEADNNEEILKILNEYFSAHSIHISIPEEKNYRDFPLDYKPVDRDMDINKFKEISKYLLKDFYYIPTEVSKASKINEVKIVDEITFSEVATGFNESVNLVNQIPKDDESQQAGPYGFYNPISKNIYLKIGDLIRNENEYSEISYRLKHELAHGFLFSYCGFFGSFSDNEFSNLNPKGFEYDISIIDNFPKTLSNKAAYTSVFEDSAFMIGDYIFLNNDEHVRNLSDTLKNKLNLNLARLNQIVPGYAEYRIKLLSRFLL